MVTATQCRSARDANAQRGLTGISAVTMNAGGGTAVDTWETWFRNNQDDTGKLESYAAVRILRKLVELAANSPDTQLVDELRAATHFIHKNFPDRSPMTLANFLNAVKAVAENPISATTVRNGLREVAAQEEAKAETLRQLVKLCLFGPPAPFQETCLSTMASGKYRGATL